MKNLLKYPCLIIISLSVFVANAKDSLIEAITISESGARMQAARMKVISENIANAESVSIRKKRPYCRRILLVKSKGGSGIVRYAVKQSFALPFLKKYDPFHPHADTKGYIYLSNVNKDIERADAAEAQVSYEANLKMMKALNSMTTNTVELFK
jgi:flagellar basal-body rod protein FlgC